MSEQSFTAEQTILVAKAARLDVSDLERQTTEPDTSALQARIQELETQVEELTAQREPQPQSLHDAQTAQGKALLNRMKSDRVGPWGWADDDGPEAA